MTKPVMRLTGRRREKRLLLTPWKKVRQMEVSRYGRTFWCNVDQLKHLPGFWKDENGMHLWRDDLPS